MNAIMEPRQIQERTKRVRPYQAAYAPVQRKAAAGRGPISIRFCRSPNGGDGTLLSGAPLCAPIWDTQAVQRRPAQEAGPAVLAGRVERRNRTGVPLPMLERAEKLGGMPLRDVRVHYNSQKPAALGALAFTQGSHIFVGPGQERHLGHELSHVVQQKRGIVRPEFHLGGIPVNASPALEGQADRWDALLSPLYTDDRGGPIPEAEVIQCCAAIQCFSILAILDWLRSFELDKALKSSIYSAGDSLMVDAQALLSTVEAKKNESTKYSTLKTVLAGAGALLQLGNGLGLVVRSMEEYEKAQNEGSSSSCWQILMRIAPYLLMVVGWLCTFVGDVLAACMPSSSLPSAVAALAATLGTASAVYSSCQAKKERENGKFHRCMMDLISSALDLAGQSMLWVCKQGTYLAPILILLELLIRALRWCLTAFECPCVTDNKTNENSANAEAQSEGSGSVGEEELPEITVSTDEEERTEEV